MMNPWQHTSPGPEPPALPDRPSFLSTPYAYGTPNYGPSPYNRFGAYGGMYGIPSYGNPMYGQASGDPNSLSSVFSQNTQATFQVIENVVGAFGGVAQMLESTYAATHSSFFAIVSVAEQFSNLRNTLGSLLGIFTLLSYLRNLIARITGRPPPVDTTPAHSQLSRKPFLIFLAAIIGLPYLMTRLLRSTKPDQAISIADLEFCQVLYDYSPLGATDVSVKTGDFVAVLSKLDPAGHPSDWWQCRTRDHRIGYLPGVYLKSLAKPAPVAQIEHGRVNTISSIIGNGQRELDNSSDRVKMTTNT